MSGYLLDTPLVTGYLRGRSGAVALVSPWIASHEAGTSNIVYGESMEYLRRFPESQTVGDAAFSSINAHSMTKGEL